MRSARARSLPAEVLHHIFRKCLWRHVIGTFPLVCRAWHQVAIAILDPEGKLPIEVTVRPRLQRTARNVISGVQDYDGVHLFLSNGPVQSRSSTTIPVSCAVNIFLESLPIDIRQIEKALLDCLIVGGDGIARLAQARGVRAVVTWATLTLLPNEWIAHPSTHQLLVQFPIRNISVTKRIMEGWTGHSGILFPSVDRVDFHQPNYSDFDCQILRNLFTVCPKFSVIIMEKDSFRSIKHAFYALAPPAEYRNRIRKVICYPQSGSSDAVSFSWALENVVQHFPNLMELGDIYFHAEADDELDPHQPFKQICSYAGPYDSVRKLRVVVQPRDVGDWNSIGVNFANAVARHLPGVIDVHFTVLGGGIADSEELTSAWVNLGRILPARRLWFDLDYQYIGVGGGVAWREALCRVRRELVGKEVHFGRGLP